MSTLSETWFIEGNIDFESKKYTLLAYLQRINRAFDDNRLYPQLADLIFHYRNLQAFRNEKQSLQQQFPKQLTGLQMQQLRLIYEEMVSDNDLMAEIEEIVYFATQRMKKSVSLGTEFYEEVENSLYIKPVGLLPLQTDEGYFFLSDSGSNSIKVYEYKMSIFEQLNDRFRALRTYFVDEWTRNFVNTYESIKGELLRVRKNFVLPAVYAIETPLSYPLEATLLPVAKRSLVRHLSTED